MKITRLKDDDVELTYTAGGDYQVYEAGTYPARLVSWESVPVPVPPRFEDQKPQFRFSWVLLDQDGNETEARLSSWVNQQFSGRSYLADVVRAVIGGDIAEGFKLSLDDLIGKECMITLTVLPKFDKFGKPAGEKNKVEAYAPIRKGPPVARKAAPAAPRAQPVAAAAGAEGELPF